MSSSNSLEREISEHTELLDENSSNTSSKETYNATNDLRVAVTTYASSFKFINYVKKRSYEEIVCSSNDTVVDFGKFGISKEALNKLIEDKDRARLEDLGGVDGIARALRSDLLNGIHDVEEDIALRREVFCVNTPENPPRKTFLQFFWRALLKFKILILIICGSVSLGLGIKVDGLKKGSKEGASIMVGVFVAVIFIAISDYWHGKVFQKLREDGYKINIEVVRGGSRQKIAVADIVVGDVVRLSYGDKVPANGLLIEQPSLKLEGCRTNCSKEDKGDPVELDVINNDIFMFSGTKVVDGSAWMLVTSVGMNARRKQKENIIHHKSTETPSLEAGLEGLDSATVWIGYILTIAGFIFAVSGGLSSTTTDDENGLEKQATGMAKANQIVGIVVTLITSAVNITDPLLLTLTLTRAYAMKKLKARNVMVRKLSALETMSFVDTICINKTTINQMKVTEFLLGNDFMVQDMYSSITLEVKRLLQEGIALNILSISPIEKAINSWALENLEMDRENIKTNFNINQIEAFTPEKKENWILAKRMADNKTIQVHLNGAAQLILQVCSWYYDASGNVNKIDHDLKLKLEQNIRSMAAKKLKCIAFAHKEVQDDAKANVLKDDMILLGIVGIEDRCRPQLKNEVKDLHNAGVKLIMITGDNICSAKDIAEQCGILEHHSGEVVEAAQFRNFTLEERKEKVNKICVMANSSPEDKRLMVECLKGNGNVVGVVVHGTNDSSAMKEAHIGIYMGKEGTAIIEEHSNIVISDGNFPSIIMILKWGRCVYCNIQKFIQFQLIVSSAALLSNNVGLVLLQKVTLSTIQLLWVGLITDTLACLAFANERPTKELIKKPPVHTEDPLVTNIMLRNILPQALFQTIVLFHMPESNGDDYQVGVTFIFNLYVFCQVFNQINARKLETKNVFEKILANKFFLGTAVFIIVLQILLVEILKLIADTTKLNWLQWSSCIGIAFSTLPIGLIVRYIPVPKTQVMSYRLVGRIIKRFRLKK